MNTTSNTNSCGNSLIDISGISDPSSATVLITQYPYWKQMYLSEYLEIPSQKPDAEQINSVVASVNILRSTVITTPRSYNDSGATPVALPNPEGKLLTGRKLIVEGQICQQIEYTANETTQSVHSVEFFVPFSAYIIVPQTVVITIGTQQVQSDSLNVDYNVHVCLEDIRACLLDQRRILKQVTMMLYAVPVGAK